jgi:hypothetical protein
VVSTEIYSTVGKNFELWVMEKKMGAFSTGIDVRWPLIYEY